jgi:hypothetical protein
MIDESLPGLLAASARPTTRLNNPFRRSPPPVDAQPTRRYVPARPSERDSSLFAGQELNIAQHARRQAAVRLSRLRAFSVEQSNRGDFPH